MVIGQDLTERTHQIPKIWQCFEFLGTTSAFLTKTCSLVPEMSQQHPDAAAYTVREIY